MYLLMKFKKKGDIAALPHASDQGDFNAPVMTQTTVVARVASNGSASAIPITSSFAFVNGCRAYQEGCVTDPKSDVDWRNAAKGLHPDGRNLINPMSGAVTKFMLDGNAEDPSGGTKGFGAGFC